MKANIGFLLIMVVVSCGVSAQATMSTQSEVSSRMTSRETIANFASYFRNTIARPSLIRLTSPTAVTEPKTSQVDLTNLNGRDLITRVAVMSNFPIGDSFKHLSDHEVFSGVVLMIHTKVELGHTLSPEEKKLLVEILKY
jgi:hypothetical protein